MSCVVLDSEGKTISRVMVRRKYYILVTIDDVLQLARRYIKQIEALVCKLGTLVGGDNVEFTCPLDPNKINGSGTVVRNKRNPTRDDFIKAYNDGSVPNDRILIFNYGHGAVNRPALLFDGTNVDAGQIINDDIINEYFSERCSAIGRSVEALTDEEKQKLVNKRWPQATRIEHTNIISKNYVCHQRCPRYASVWHAKLPKAEFYFSGCNNGLDGDCTCIKSNRNCLFPVCNNFIANNQRGCFNRTNGICGQRKIEDRTCPLTLITPICGYFATDIQKGCNNHNFEGKCKRRKTKNDELEVCPFTLTITTRQKGCNFIPCCKHYKSNADCNHDNKPCSFPRDICRFKPTRYLPIDTCTNHSATHESKLLIRFLNDLVAEIKRITNNSANERRYEYKPHVGPSGKYKGECIGFENEMMCIPSMDVNGEIVKCGYYHKE